MTYQEYAEEYADSWFDYDGIDCERNSTSSNEGN